MKLDREAFERQRLAQTLLDLAAEAEEADLRIKKAILEAMGNRDFSLVESIVQRWMTNPPTEVVGDLPPGESL